MENPCVIRILLADRQEIFRDGLKRLLESEPHFVVVGGAGSARETLQLVRDFDPDVLLLDLALNGGDSLQILRTLAATPHRVRTIGLTAGVESDLLNAAMRHGARGSIRKESATALLFRTSAPCFTTSGGSAATRPCRPSTRRVPRGRRGTPPTRSGTG